MTNPRRRRGNKWLDGFVPYQVYRITNGLNQRLRSRLRRLHINISRWRVLSVLRAFGTLTVNEIAELAVMEQPTVSRTVSQLVRDGLVSRASSKRDSRFVEISMTADGQRAFQEIYPIALEHQTTALRGFSAKEIATLSGYLHRIQDNIFSASSDDN